MAAVPKKGIATMTQEDAKGVDIMPAQRSNTYIRNEIQVQQKTIN